MTDQQKLTKNSNKTKKWFEKKPNKQSKVKTIQFIPCCSPAKNI